MAPNSFGFTHFVTTVTDNGPADSGLDTYGPVGGFAPFPCTPTLNQEPLTSGDIVVTDCVAGKGEKGKCKGGGGPGDGDDDDD